MLTFTWFRGRGSQNSIPARGRRARPLSVELVEILEARLLLAMMDFGDAPAVYGTRLVDDGARHIAIGPMLGFERDSEADGVPSANADGDDIAGPTDDEDGVMFSSAIIVGQSNASVSVNVQGAPSGAALNAWIDFAGNGLFDASDRIANDLPVLNGSNTVTFNVPGTAVAGNTFARFRLSTATGVGPTGLAADGEVEDYHVTLSPVASPTQTGTLDTTHYIPPFYAVSGLNSNFIGTQYLALSTPETTPFAVTLSNAAGFTQTVTISKSAPQILNLSAAPFGTAQYGSLGIVDDFGLNQVNNSDGFILTGSKPFYANVRQLSGSQAESLTAKGRTALGTRFRSGHMNSSTTSNANDDVHGHFISVMAAEDNTTVTFSEVHPGIVFRNGNGTLAGTPGPVTLDRGESYVIGVRLTDIAAANQNNLNGTLITSDKSIVVNSGSWTAGPGTTGQDVGFDQIVPSSVVGTQYILAKGQATTLAGLLETPIVVADSNNTQIFLNGSSTPIATINAGDFFVISGTNFSTSNTMYIRTSQRAYVYQTTAGANNDANLGMNFAGSISDPIQPQEIVIADADQLGTATMAIVARTGASVSLTDGTLGTPQNVVGVSGYQIYRQPVSGDVDVNSDQPLIVSLTTASGVATSAAYFSGVPNTNAVDDTAITRFNTPVTIAVQANDNSAGRTFMIASATDPANGSIVVNLDGTITFTPDSGFSGVDTFDYTITDGLSTDTATVTISVIHEVDLVVSKSGSADPIVAGSGSGNLTYVVAVSNAGPSDTSRVVLSEDLTLPAGVTVVSVTPSQGTFSNTTGPDGTWTVGSLATGSSATLTVVLTVSSSTPDGVTISNTATVTAAAGTLLNTGDDTATVSTSVIRRVDLVVTQTESSDPVIAGSGSGNLTYVVTVRNAGPSDASGVVLSDVLSLPTGASVGSITPSGSTTFVGSTWTVGTLAVGSSETLTLVLTVGPSTADGASICNAAAVTAANETDTATGNDSNTECTSVIRQVDLVVTGTESPDPVIVGSVTVGLRYVFTLTSNGPSDASGVVLSDLLILPTGVSLTSVTPSGSTSFSGTTWTVGDLQPGASERLTVVLAVGTTASPGRNTVSSTAAVSLANETLINPLDDAATVSTSIVTPGSALLVDCPFTPGQVAVAVAGFLQSDNLDINENASQIEVKFLKGTRFQTSFPREGVCAILAWGLEGNDFIHVGSSDKNRVATPAFVFGGPGNDHLHVEGGDSPDVLVGGDGDDHLETGTNRAGQGLGRDVLIAGRGHDRIKASAGDNILIAGFTDFDGDLAALGAISAEWTRTGQGADAQKDYQTRVDHLLGLTTGGLNGLVQLNRTTVHDDGKFDVVNGFVPPKSQQDQRDWFMVNVDGDGDPKKKDKATGVGIGEVVTDINLP